MVIPAFNEEASVSLVINDIPASWVREVVVVNNNSTDNTAAVAKSAGATVLHEPRQGYGASCLKGMAHLASMTRVPDIVVFMDADYADFPEELPKVVQPIINGSADMVIGSRVPEWREKGAMMPQQLFGNRLATTLLKLLYKQSFTDLGPFRAISYEALTRLGMCDKDYGWTVEMQIKAAKQGLRCAEVPVSYRVRVGKSKVSGTVKGSLMAGYKIISTLLKYA